jgi:hypothetical protein
MNQGTTSPNLLTNHSVLSFYDVSDSDFMVGCLQADHWKGEQLVGDVVHGPEVAGNVDQCRAGKLIFWALLLVRFLLELLHTTSACASRLVL